MEECRDDDEMRQRPVGRWLALGLGVVFCASASLCGLVLWGRPDVAQARRTNRLFEGYVHLAERFDVILDASLVEHVDPAALAELLAWLGPRWSDLQARMRARVGIVPPGPGGLMVAGITPVLGGAAVRVVPSLHEGARLVLGDAGDALAGELDAIVARARAVSPMLTALRSLLARARGALDLGEAARALGVSARSLQRSLADAGSTYRGEQADARFTAAEELLAGDLKLAAVAAELGIGEDALAALVHARTGLTPGELRRRQRGER